MTRTVQQLFDLKGKTALVTGGSRGLGLQMAHALGEAGARIMLSSRKAADLEEAVADLEAALAVEDSPMLRQLLADAQGRAAEAHTPALPSKQRRALHTILDEGPLARRMERFVGSSVTETRLLDLSRRMIDCLATGSSLGST